MYHHHFEFQNSNRIFSRLEDTLFFISRVTLIRFTARIQRFLFFVGSFKNSIVVLSIVFWNAWPNSFKNGLFPETFAWSHQYYNIKPKGSIHGRKKHRQQFNNRIYWVHYVLISCLLLFPVTRLQGDHE